MIRKIKNMIFFKALLKTVAAVTPPIHDSGGNHEKESYASSPVNSYCNVSTRRMRSSCSGSRSCTRR